MTYYFQEEQELLEETFGSLKPVGHEDFLLAYDQWGIELDNRREVVNSLLTGFEKTSFPRLITFIRDFPGFGPLKFSDVLSLLKCKYCYQHSCDIRQQIKSASIGRGFVHANLG